MNDLRSIGWLSVWILGGGLFYMGRSLGLNVSGWHRDRTVWLALAVLAATLIVAWAWRRIRLRHFFVPGDRVIYQMQKFSPAPGRRAEDVYAVPNGEGYSYIVRKPWTVSRLVGEDGLEVVTRGGKHRIVRVDDPHLLRAGPLSAFWFALRTRKPFPRTDRPSI